MNFLPARTTQVHNGYTHCPPPKKNISPSLLLIFLERLCHKKWLILFSLKFQKDNQQNMLAVDSVNGKTG